MQQNAQRCSYSRSQHPHQSLVYCAEWMYGESGDGKGAADGRDEQTAGQEGPCKVAANGGALPVEKHAVCFNDRGRSPEANKLPGGAVCFGGHAGLWHALRALVQTYEFCN